MNSFKKMQNLHFICFVFLSLVQTQRYWHWCEHAHTTLNVSSENMLDFSFKLYKGVGVWNMGRREASRAGGKDKQFKHQQHVTPLCCVRAFCWDSPPYIQYSKTWKGILLLYTVMIIHAETQHVPSFSLKLVPSLHSSSFYLTAHINHFIWMWCQALDAVQHKHIRNTTAAISLNPVISVYSEHCKKLHE